MSRAHAKRLGDQGRRASTSSEVELLKTLPLRFEFDKIEPHPSFMRHLNELRREGYLQMVWSEVKRTAYPNTMTASLFRAHGCNGLDRVEALNSQKLFPVTVKVLEVTRHVTVDQEKAKQDAINAAAGKIKNLRGKKARKLQPTLKGSEAAAKSAKTAKVEKVIELA